MIDKIATIKPVITERSFDSVGRGWYTFWVDKSIGKDQAKGLIEELFNVKVKDIKSCLLKGKSKRQAKTKKLTIISPRKKIMVRLAKDQKIDLFETGGKQ